jgi:hypothetical protein
MDEDVVIMYRPTINDDRCIFSMLGEAGKNSAKYFHNHEQPEIFP